MIKKRSKDIITNTPTPLQLTPPRNSRTSDVVFISSADLSILLDSAKKVDMLYSDHQSEEQQREAKKSEQQQRKARRVAARVRCPIVKGDYHVVMDCVKFKSRTKVALYRVGLTILFLTGIRLGNLRTIHKEDLRRLFAGEDFIIKAIKTRELKALSFPSSQAFKHYLDLRRADFEMVMQNTPDGALVWAVSREHLTREVNNILQEASKVLNKNLKSHSFRIGVATATVERFSILEAKALLGHARISTTERYVPSQLTMEAKANIANTILLDPKPTETHEGTLGWM